MILKRIEISNFKSFDHLAVDLNPLNVLVGANASGKSNFVQVFKFLRDIVDHGLENAVSLQGNFSFLQNINLRDHPLSIKLMFENAGNTNFLTTSEQNGLVLADISPLEGSYEFSLKPKRNQNFSIENDVLTLNKYNVTLVALANDSKGERFSDNDIRFFTDKNTLKYEISNERSKANNLFAPQFKAGIKYPAQKLLLESEESFVPIAPLRNFLRSLKIFDFDAKKMKEATSFKSKKELAEDGNNLAFMVQEILKGKDAKASLLRMANYFLPSVKDIKTSKIANRSIYFSLQEQFSKNKEYLPAFLLSEGTVFLIALLVALFFNEGKGKKTPFIIFEEPEQHTHPSLIPGIMNLLKEIAENQQIMLTTHSSQIVKHSDLANLFLLSREKNGFTEFIKPVNSTIVKTFVENEIGVEELYIQNLLGD